MATESSTPRALLLRELLLGPTALLRAVVDDLLDLILGLELAS